MGTPVYAGIENRPINTDDAYTLDRGALTSSFGGVTSREENRDEQISITADLGFGITDYLEVTVDIPYQFLDPKSGSDSDGFGDISIRPEWMFFSEHDYRPAVSIAGTIKFDNGDNDKNLGSGAVDFSISLQSSKAFGLMVFHLNIGYTEGGAPAGADKDDVVFHNIAGEYALSQKLKLVGELISQTNSDPNAGDPLEWLFGVLYETKKHIIVDAGFGTGLTDASPDVRLTAGVTYEF